jgi:hypothetical protein
MDAAIAIREAISRVTALRRETQSSMSLKAAAGHIKSLQARRFAGTYEDLLSSSDYSGAARFFLDDLYSDTDYSSRDAQFARMAGGLQRLFPQKVVGTAVALAKETPSRLTGRFRCNSLTMTYFHTGTRTIIGAEAFHCPVRDGKEWYHLAMVVRHNFLSS